MREVLLDMTTLWHLSVWQKSSKSESLITKVEQALDIYLRRSEGSNQKSRRRITEIMLSMI